MKVGDLVKARRDRVGLWSDPTNWVRVGSLAEGELAVVVDVSDTFFSTTWVKVLTHEQQTGWTLEHNLCVMATDSSDHDAQ